MENGRTSPASKLTLRWIDAVKGLALLWIVWNHIAERIFGFPLIANPTLGWPPLGDRIAQLAPIGHGISGIFLNASRYIGWTGDQGVGLFIIISGFLLALGDLRRPMDTRTFFARRLVRIYPLWIAVHITFILLWFAIGKGLDPTDPRTIASIIGLRFLPTVFYYFVPAWWYVGLALQLYLIFPLLALLMRRMGALRFTVACIVVGCAIRGIGLYAFGSFVDEWSRGGVFIARLPEFALGMGLAAAFVRNPEGLMRTLRSPQIVAAAFIVWLAGNALSLTLWGMSIAPLVLTASTFVLAYALVAWCLERISALENAVEWSGRHSYSLYLTNQPFIAILVGGAAASRMRHAEGIVAALIGSAVLALLLEWISERVEGRVRGLSSTYGGRRLAIASLAALLCIYAVLLGAEAVVRTKAPLEVFGWGERPSLEPDRIVGWKLKPNETHRLRWTSYDYTVQSNALGFPGPLYPDDRPRRVFRIMTLGDAFTSAEGVDTPDSWPRKLEGLLAAQTGRPVQVLNFGITGYGPNQYAAVTAEYAPRFHPDLIVIGMFINDLEDALRSDPNFRSDIGFENPPPNGIVSLLELEQLKAYWSLRVRAPVIAALLRRPSPEGAFLANIRFFDRSQEPRWLQGAQITEQRYAEIQAIGRASGARLAIALFPASVQVCGPADLKYYPHHFNLNDSARYDPNFPQRTAAAIAQSLKIPFDDLRGALRDGTACPYQPRNMHLTVYGQDLAAHAVAEFLEREALVPPVRRAVAGSRKR
jgi:peptidoglycan/LPS O-acetylase OafA/YrhL